MTDQHSFVATIKVEKVKKAVNQDRQSASHGAIKRDVVETLNLTVRASSLSTLKEKVSAHISMLDEEDVEA